MLTKDLQWCTVWNTCLAFKSMFWLFQIIRAHAARRTSELQNLMCKTIRCVKTLKRLGITNMIWIYWKINHIVLSKAVVTIANEWIKHQINFLSKHESNDSTVFYSVVISECLTCRHWPKGKLGALKELCNAWRNNMKQWYCMTSYLWIQLLRLWSLCREFWSVLVLVLNELH